MTLEQAETVNRDQQSHPLKLRQIAYRVLRSEGFENVNPVLKED